MIKFGTGGWRAIIAEDFTKENLQKLTQAICMEITQPQIIIGYDRRFLSDLASKWIAEVFAGNHVDVLFINKAIPTPIIMFAINKLDLEYGVAVTASHNPASYNGVKLFTRGGRDATEMFTNKLESNLSKVKEIKMIDFEEGIDTGKIKYFSPQNDYIDSILAFVNTKAIRNANLKVLIDTMHGVSKTSLSIILNTARCDVDVINDRHDTLFGGKLPSPSSATLHKLSEMVRLESYHMGIATDGDADRIGIIDERGNFIHPNILISLIYYYLLEYKGWKGAAVRNLSTTHLIDKIALDHGEEVIETAVGFKHITAGMEQHNALIGGESSGGLTIRGHIHGKDGIFAAALLVEMISVTKKHISELVDDLYKTYGKLYVGENAYHFNENKKQQILKLLMIDKAIPNFKKEVEKINYMDGFKIYFKDGSWASARFSGTEPLLRIFTEADSIETNNEYINILESFLDL
ncbi:MAG: phosphoglucomutase/phosphomannomutase family protein [Breznakia sp.]